MDKEEQVAIIIHDLWMGWAKTLIESEPDLSQERKERWINECFKPYDELSEEMKNLDRKFAKQIIETIK
jgi:hypothetical protein